MWPSRRTLGTAWLVLAALLPAPGLAADSRESSRESLEQVKQRIESLRKELESTQSAHAEAADALRESERAISDANRALYQLHRQQQHNRDSLKNLAQASAALEQKIRAQQQQLGSHLRQQYMKGQASHLQLLLSQQDPHALARELYYFSELARARSRQIDALRRDLAQVAELNEKTASTLQEIETLEARQQAERQQLEQEKQKRAAVMTTLAQQLKSQRSEISKLKRDERRLSDLVKRLARIAPKVRATPKAQAARGAARPSEALANTALPSRELGNAAFARLKGKLNLPVRGTVVNRFGSAREDSGVSWKGLFIRAQEGAQVKSIAPGTVVFADWLRGFGNLIIVDHGDDYMSLYGNNQTLLKQVGDQVAAGDDIAAAGNSGGNAEAGVYFELRHRSNPLNPLAWCMAR